MIIKQKGAFTMKLLLCNTIRRDGGVAVESDVYNDFKEAIEQYTLLCAACDHVVLADIEKEVIIRQYAHAEDHWYEGSVSTGVCIF